MAEDQRSNERFNTLAELYESLPDAARQRVYSGGTAWVEVSPDNGVTWYSATFTVDGVWLNDPSHPGYIHEPDLHNWRIR